MIIKKEDMHLWINPVNTKKSSTCVGKQSNKPLSEYFSLEDARAGAVYAKKSHGSNFVPYKCQNCGFWHLSPKDRHTASNKNCTCTDRDGNSKNLYTTHEDAKRRADIIFKEKQIKTTVYKCQYNNGWHLTKS